MNIADKLYKLRTERGLTQADIGKIAGVSDKTISTWESGTRCPKVVPYIQNICTHFHLDMLTFIDDSTDDFGYGSDYSNSEQPTAAGELSEGEQEIIRLFRQLPKEAQDTFPALLEASLKAGKLL